ncbi:MAG: hypothetical protein PHT12_00070 [Patescibacteria group bacterium]|nr:hypothetical protein [Patescibacteria group bacterium]
MLEQLFGSKTRVRLLRLFLNDGKGQYFVRELTRRIGAQINAVRNELENLIRLDLVVAVEEPHGADGKARRPQRKKFYRLNTDSLLYPELKALFVKSRVLLEKDLVRKLTASGNISYLALTGVFVGLDEAPTDLLIVGRISREKLAPLVRDFQREVGREINYTVLTPQEFRYRREMTDRFLFSILESKKLVVIDTITGQPAPAGTLNA